LLADEASADGREDNNPGFRPNLAYLRGWLRKEYPEHEDLETWLDQQFFELPKEIQARYKEEGQRYEKRLPKAAKEEMETAQASREWNTTTPEVIHQWLDTGYFRRASIEQKRANTEALSDLLKAMQEDLREAEKKLKGGKGK
jgi:hypothetical protein